MTLGSQKKQRSEGRQGWLVEGQLQWQGHWATQWSQGGTSLTVSG